MHVFEEKKKFSKELTTVILPAGLFKVVVNNYKLQKEKHSGEPVDADERKMTAESIGLPPQPASYLKYPEYDWL